MARSQADSSVHLLKVHVLPNARKTEIVGMHGEALKIKIKAVPEDGKANTELCAFLAETLGIAKSKVHVVKGQTSRAKLVSIDGVDLATIEKLKASTE
ncbi:MAG: YggU family protein [Bdellovibrionaceae bacterium]|nr:YggU family protein [Pseudobdellovibrionaceae bacterium]